MNFSEANHFINLVAKQKSQGFMDDWILEWRNKEHELLYARLSKIPHYYLVLPENIYNQTETKRTVNDLLLNLLP